MSDTLHTRTAHVLGIGTATPRARLSQPATRDFFRAQPGVDRLTSRLIGAAFDQSAIDTRYSVIGGIGEEATAFADGGVLRSPTTRERNELYRREVPGLCFGPGLTVETVSLTRQSGMSQA